MPDFVPEVHLWEYRDGSVHAEMMLASFFEDESGESRLVCHVDGNGTLRSACGKSYFAKAHATGLGDPARVDCPECRKLIGGVRLVPARMTFGIDEFGWQQCEGHESTDGPIGNVEYCDGSCRPRG